MDERPKCENQAYHVKKDTVRKYLCGRGMRKNFLKNTQKAQIARQKK